MISELFTCENTFKIMLVENQVTQLHSLLYNFIRHYLNSYIIFFRTVIII